MRRVVQGECGWLGDWVGELPNSTGTSTESRAPFSFVASVICSISLKIKTACTNAKHTCGENVNNGFEKYADYMESLD